MTTIRRLVCWGFCWLALIGATPAYGQVEDVSFCFSPRSLDISAVVGAAPTQHVLGVNVADPDCRTDEGDLVSFSVTYLNGTGWLSVPSPFSATQSQAEIGTVTVNYAALPMAGVYQALIIITVTEPDGDSFIATIPVTVTLSEQVEDVSFCFSPRALNISAIVGTAPTQHVILDNEEAIPDCKVDETVSLNISVTFLNGTSWLSVPPSVTFAPGQVNSFTVTVNYAALPMAGVYQAQIIGTTTDPETQMIDAQATIPVTVTLSEARARLPLSQTAFLFQVVQDGPAPPAQTLRVFNDGTGTLNWSLSGLPSWLTASPLLGTSNAGQSSATTLTADPTGLAPGVLQALVTVSAPGATNDPQLFSVTLLVAPASTPASADISPQGLLFLAEQGGTMPATKDLTVSNAGGGTLTADFLASTESGGEWLMVTPSSGTTSAGPFTLQGSVNPAALAAGVYRGKLTGTFSSGLQQEGTLSR